ncbi:MAG: hypothetical protein H6747_11080 [Deltaproteobacteria bacterium]|nr:hypothetical protein [Deltaproteobacteria bacterium]
MPYLTAKQRLQKLVALYGAREGLRRLLAEDGVATAGAAAGSTKPLLGKALELPSWITPERAAAIVQHFLHGQLLLPWHLAPFWQDRWVAEEWPMVGAPAASGWEQGEMPAAQPFEASEPAFPQFEDLGTLPGVAPPPVLPTAPPALWTTLVELYGDNVWLWTKYRKYFLPVAGAQPLLAGVLLAHEVDQGPVSLELEIVQTAAQVSPKALVEVDCFAYTLAVAIGTLESVDFATGHNVMPKGYPSQWQAPEPPPTLWASPLHGDQRFWHEFDEPPVGDRRRYVRQGLTRLEAVRVWARRVAICLWGDANGHWGRWPWRLEVATQAELRLLLAWDPRDWRIQNPSTSYPTAAIQDQYPFWDLKSIATTTDTDEPLLCECSQLFWPLKTQGRDVGWIPIGFWDTNPYLAWQLTRHSSTFAWQQSSDVQTHSLRAAAAATGILRSSGFCHGSGNLKPSEARIAPRYRAFGNDYHDLNMAELMNFNNSGCQANGPLLCALLRAMSMPNRLSQGVYPKAPQPTVHVIGSQSVGLAVMAPATISDDGYGHKAVLVQFCDRAYYVSHADDALSWLGLRFTEPHKAWLALEEYMLLLATRDGTVWFSHRAALTKEACIHGDRWVTQAHDAMLDLAGPSEPQGALPWFRWPRRAWDDTLQKSTVNARTSVVALLAQHGEEVLEPSTLAAHAAWPTARILAAKFLTGDYGKVQAAIPGTKFSGYLRGADSAYNKRFCGTRGQLPANYIIDGKGAHDDPEVVVGILRIALWLNSQWQDV